MAVLPSYLQPFVVPVPAREPQRQGTVDLYLPEDDTPHPAIVFVHGGPVPADRRPTPRDWPVFRGYGALAATRGVVGVTLDHRLHSLADYPHAAEDVASAVAFVRSIPRVDADRIAVWHFSGAGLLLADWLREPAPWLRCAAATYPLLALPSGSAVDPRFDPIAALATTGPRLPVVLTRAGKERPALAEAVERFVAAARTHQVRLALVDVPDGQHGFDMLDHTDASRDAVERAMNLVIAALHT